MPRLKSREYQQARALWLQERLTGIGASDAAAICGVNPWKSALMLYAEKIGAVPPSDEHSGPMEWGHRLEDPIAEAYEEETGRTTRDLGAFVIQRHKEYSFLMATLDRRVSVLAAPPANIIVPPAIGDGVLEIKTTNAWNKAEWEEEPPLYYQVQVQHQMMVTALEWGSLAVLIGGQEFLWQDHTRNDGFIVKLMALEIEFWDRVQRRDPPPPDASESSSEALKLLYPQEERDTCVLPAELIEADDNRQRAIGELEKWQRLRDESENRIKAAIGPFTFGFLPNMVRYSWKLQKKGGYTVAPSQTRVLRRQAPKGSNA